MQNLATTPATPKTLKANPSASLIGMKLTADAVKTVNFRKGKGNVISCNEIEVTAANDAGRRLTLVFKNNGQDVLTRRVYKEHFEKMAEVFGIQIP
jgi:hypothetical protein